MEAFISLLPPNFVRAVNVLAGNSLPPHVKYQFQFSRVKMTPRMIGGFLTMICPIYFILIRVDHGGLSHCYR